MQRAIILALLLSFPAFAETQIHAFTIYVCGELRFIWVGEYFIEVTDENRRQYWQAKVNDLISMGAKVEAREVLEAKNCN